MYVYVCSKMLYCFNPSQLILFSFPNYSTYTSFFFFFFCYCCLTVLQFQCFRTVSAVFLREDERKGRGTGNERNRDETLFFVLTSKVSLTFLNFFFSINTYRYASVMPYCCCKCILFCFVLLLSLLLLPLLLTKLYATDQSLVFYATGLLIIQLVCYYCCY